jgi:delta14-sterol reductase
MRPGLILWIVIDLSMVAYQYSTIGRVTDSMILTVAFHSWYVLDAEFNEVRLVLQLSTSRQLVADAVSSFQPAILTTMVRMSAPVVHRGAILTCLTSAQDITTDGFGFMLSVGDLLWVPFTYSYTAYYLAFHPKDIGLSGCAGVLAVQLVGYWIFRSSNNEKNEFRSGRNPKSAFV